MPRESKHERIVEAIRHLLAAMRTSNGYFYRPDRVGRFLDLRQAWFLDTSYNVLYLLSPRDERVTEQINKQLSMEMELQIACLRRLKVPEGQDELAPGELVVAPVAWADGALTLAQQPVEPSPLTFMLDDADASVTAGTLTVVGTDPEGLALTVTYSPATHGTEYSPGMGTGGAEHPGGTFASITSATVSGASGGASTDRVRVLAGASTSTIQNRMVRDVLLAIGGQAQLMSYVEGVENVEVASIDRNEPFEGWALAIVNLTVKYTTPRATP